MEEYAELVPAVARGEVLEYLAGRRRKFSADLMRATTRQAGTEFQRAVWRAIAEIPYGEVRSYREIAARIGRPGAVRAVGTACGKNGWPIVVPCHRVVATGGLGGYAFGLAMKKRLLALEKAVLLQE